MSSILEFRPGRFRVVYYKNGERIALCRDEKLKTLKSKEQAERLVNYLQEYGYDPRVFGRAKILPLYSNLTESDKEVIRQSSEKCEICGKENLQLVVDHDHETNRVRGVLCKKCNVMLGLVSDDIGLLAKATLYLVKNLSAPHSIHSQKSENQGG